MDEAAPIYPYFHMAAKGLGGCWLRHLCAVLTSRPSLTQGVGHFLPSPSEDLTALLLQLPGCHAQPILCSNLSFYTCFLPCATWATLHRMGLGGCSPSPVQRVSLIPLCTVTSKPMKPYDTKNIYQGTSPDVSCSTHYSWQWCHHLGQQG